jgi:tetratricopeptide (TPR) repeat protein
MVAHFRRGAVGILLSLLVFTPVGRAGAAPGRPQDALVLVSSEWRGAHTYSHGLVVGDGSLVVALYHAVFDELSEGRHRLTKRVTVASPAWGDVTDAEIVAWDAERRLALLQVPWRGHPALKLADDRRIVAADCMIVAGMAGVVDALSGKSQGEVDATALFQEVAIGVDYVAVRDGKPFLVRLREEGEVSVPWFGVPALLPDTGEVAAIVWAHSVSRVVEARVLNRMAELADRLRTLGPPATGTTEPVPVNQAREAFLLSVRIGALFGDRKYEQAAAACRKFIALRPKCFYGYVYAALAAEQLEQRDEAERCYLEAVVQASDSLTAKSAYAGFLDRRGHTEEAMQIFESLWQRTAWRPYLWDAICVALSHKQEHGRSCRFLEEALAVDPNNAYALIALGNHRNALREYAAAAEAFGKAAELCPEHETVRAHFAKNLELAGRDTEAEAQYRQAVAAHPKCEYAHHMFAGFLAQHRPEYREEALREARAALDLPNDSASDRDKIERLIRDLEAKGP